MSEKYILVVDDDPSVGIVFQMALRPLGIEIKVALDGCEALAAIEARTPAVILLDLMMPCLDGYEVMDKLKSDPITAQIPIIIFSAVVGSLRQGKQTWPAQVVEVVEKGSARPSAIRAYIEDVVLATA